MKIAALIFLAMLCIGLGKKDEDDSLVAPDGSVIDPFGENLFDSHWLRD